MKHDDSVDISQLPEVQVVEVEHTDRMVELESLVRLDPSVVGQPVGKSDWSVN